MGVQVIHYQGDFLSLLVMISNHFWQADQERQVPEFLFLLSVVSGTRPYKLLGTMGHKDACKYREPSPCLQQSYHFVPAVLPILSVAKA
jgi:hypothetical protein